MTEIDDLKHDIERHVAICAEQATRIAALEETLKIILLIADINPNHALNECHAFARKGLGKLSVW